MECTYRVANSMDSSKFKVLNDKFNGPNCNSIEIIRRYFSNTSSDIVFVAEDNIKQGDGSLFEQFCLFDSMSVLETKYLKGQNLHATVK